MSVLVPDGFIAPEAAGSDYTASRDVFALGILTLCVLLGWKGNWRPKTTIAVEDPLIKQDRELHDFLSKCLHQ